jgi:hypothetical protein
MVSIYTVRYNTRKSTVVPHISPCLFYDSYNKQLSFASTAFTIGFPSGRECSLWRRNRTRIRNGDSNETSFDSNSTAAPLYQFIRKCSCWCNRKCITQAHKRMMLFRRNFKVLFTWTDATEKFSLTCRVTLNTTETNSKFYDVTKKCLPSKSRNWLF